MRTGLRDSALRRVRSGAAGRRSRGSRGYKGAEGTREQRGRGPPLAGGGPAGLPRSSLPPAASALGARTSPHRQPNAKSLEISLTPVFYFSSVQNAPHPAGQDGGSTSPKIPVLPSHPRGKPRWCKAAPARAGRAPPAAGGAGGCCATGPVSPRPHLLLRSCSGRWGGASWCPRLRSVPMVSCNLWLSFPMTRSGVGETWLWQGAGEAEGVFSSRWDQAW